MELDKYKTSLMSGDGLAISAGMSQHKLPYQKTLAL